MTHPKVQWLERDKHDALITASYFANFTSCMSDRPGFASFFRAAAYFNNPAYKWKTYRMRASSNGAGGESSPRQPSPTRFLGSLRNRTMVLVGESVVRDVFAMLCCWLLSAAHTEGVVPASEHAQIASASRAWHGQFYAALQERKVQLLESANITGFRTLRNGDHPFLYRIRKGTPFPHNGQALVLPQYDCVLAFVDTNHNFRPYDIDRPLKGLTSHDEPRLLLGPDLSHTWLRDWVLPVLGMSKLTRNKPVHCVLQSGMSSNVPGSLIQAAGSGHATGPARDALVAGARHNFALLSSQWAEVVGAARAAGPSVRLLLLECPPQHFATPWGLYAEGDDDAWARGDTRAGPSKRHPCAAIARGVRGISSNPNSTEAGEDEEVANFRNRAMAAGAARAFARSPPCRQCAKSYHVLPVWEALAKLPPRDAHGWHLDDGNASNANDPPEKGKCLRPVYDCTHSSPDSAWFLVEGLYQELTQVERLVQTEQVLNGGKHCNVYSRSPPVVHQRS